MHESAENPFWDALRQFLTDFLANLSHIESLSNERIGAIC